MIICPKCGLLYSKNGIGTHMWRKHGDGKNHNPNSGYDNGRTAWNKGLTKEHDPSLKKASETYKAKVKSGEIVPSFLGKHHSKETSERISAKLSVNNKGGKCKWFEYQKKNGTFFNLQGTWEVRFAVVLDKIDPDWIKIGVGKKSHSFEWIDENKQSHSYTPDFYCPNLNKYFEVKGYWWGDDKNKMQQVISQNQNVQIEIVLKKDLEAYEKIWR